MALKFTVVDAFTDKPFSGNPAAVVILPSDHLYPDAILQGIATEMNLSETAYVIEPPKVDKRSAGYQPQDESYVSYGLRWFTPQEEFPLCGHATLAASSILFADETRVPANINEIHFSTLSGILKARRIAVENPSPMYELEFPASDIVEASNLVTDRVREAVVQATNPEVEVKFVGVCSTPLYKPYLLVEIDDKLPLEGIKVDPGILGKLVSEHILTILCQRPTGDSTADFHYRVFAVPAGLMEDPVCGSATSFSAKYWAGRIAALRNEGGAEATGSSTTSHSGDKIAMKIRAVSRRGGDIELVWEESSQTAKIRGNARVASRGEIYI